MTNIELTRENIIDLVYQVRALERKSQCRAVYCDFIDKLSKIGDELAQLDYDLTEHIGD